MWPTKGKLAQQFRPQAGKQGIDIAGTAGQPVYAALDGEVVYAGNGLKGYGNLIIVKHHSELLSAYAHNQEFYVQEGQKVTQKQRIASMGMDNNRRAVLHFQIRKDGTPVNPVKYLP
jgi:lipoprotein NlpD